MRFDAYLFIEVRWFRIRGGVRYSLMIVFFSNAKLSQTLSLWCTRGGEGQGSGCRQMWGYLRGIYSARDALGPE